MNSLKSLVVVIVFWCISNIKSSQALSFDDYPKLGLVVTSANSFEKIGLKNLYTLPNHPNFNQNFKTVLYGYGYTQYFEEATVQTIMKAYHKRGGYNFLVIDWSSYNSGDYFQTRDNLTDIGKLFGRKFYEMELESNYTLKVNKFHFVGHSMGAHLVAKIARSFFKASNLANLKIEHITALDPAGIGFYDPINSIFQAPLQKNDAYFVDVIHTDSIYFGTSSIVGHVDFWPNDGKLQPKCPKVQLSNINLGSNFCSHQRSTYYFAESVATLDKKTFKSCRDRKLKKCGVIAYMGLHVDQKLEEGSYYTETNGESPYNIDNISKN